MPPIRLCFREHLTKSRKLVFWKKDNFDEMVRVWVNRPEHGELIRFNLLTKKEFAQLQDLLKILPKIGVEITLEYYPTQKSSINFTRSMKNGL